MLIKSRNFSPTKTERTFEQDGFGWAPGQEKKFEGVQKNTVRFGKNHSMIFGSCAKCDKLTDKRGTNGEHCSLPANEACQK